MLMNEKSIFMVELGSVAAIIFGVLLFTVTGLWIAMVGVFLLLCCLLLKGVRAVRERKRFSHCVQRTFCYHDLIGDRGMMRDAYTCMRCGYSKYPEVFPSLWLYKLLGRVEENPTPEQHALASEAEQRFYDE